MGKVTKPMLLDETGKEMVSAMELIANAIGESADYSLEQYATGIVMEESSNPAWTRKGTLSAIDKVINDQGSWVFDPVRKIRAKLSASDHNVFEDGTEWDGVTGDAFRHFGKLNYLVKTDEYGNKTVWGSSHAIGGHEFDENWIGCYKGHVDANGKLRSIPNVQCLGGKTMTDFWNCAQANSSDYGLMNYRDHCKMLLMHYLHFGNANSETTMGKGLQDAGGGTDSEGKYFYQPTTGYCHAIGDGTGEAQYKDSAHNMNCLFGVEGLAGAQWEFRPGIRFSGDNAIVYEGNIVSNIAEGRTFACLRSASGDYIKSMVLGEYFDMIPNTVGGGATTYYCDGNWASTSGELLLVGGNSDYGSLCGLSFSYSYLGFSVSYSYVGARLAFFGDASEYAEVSGANFMA